MRGVFRSIIIVAVVLMLSAPAWAKEKKDASAFQFGTDPAVAAVRPKSPVSIKLKRLKDGSYTWELQGDDPDEILRVDKRLRDVLKKKK